MWMGAESDFAKCPDKSMKKQLYLAHRANSTDMSTDPQRHRAASSSRFLPLFHPMEERVGRGGAFLLMPLSSVLSPLVPRGARMTSLMQPCQHQLITVYMVQHAGYPNDGGKKIVPAFKKAAAELYAK
jgi:hypothetical protein